MHSDVQVVSCWLHVPLGTETNEAAALCSTPTSSWVRKATTSGCDRSTGLSAQESSRYV